MFRQDVKCNLDIEVIECLKDSSMAPKVVSPPCKCAIGILKGRTRLKTFLLLKLSKDQIYYLYKYQKNFQVLAIDLLIPYGESSFTKDLTFKIFLNLYFKINLLLIHIFFLGENHGKDK